jgi:hypothetical protein
VPAKLTAKGNAAPENIAVRRETEKSDISNSLSEVANNDSPWRRLIQLAHKSLRDAAETIYATA